MTWFFTTFAANAIKARMRRVTSLQELYNFINPDQLDLPDFVYEYDRRTSKNYAFSARIVEAAAPVRDRDGGSL